MPDLFIAQVAFIQLFDNDRKIFLLNEIMFKLTVFDILISGTVNLNMRYKKDSTSGVDPKVHYTEILNGHNLL